MASESRRRKRSWTLPDLIKITGLEDVQRYLDEAPQNVVRKGFQKALAASIGVLKGELQLRTPVDRGELRAAIRSRVKVDSDARGGIASLGFGKQSHVANWVEYGHRMVGHKPGKKLIGQVPAHPFVRPTFDAAADRAVEAFAASFSDSVREEYEQREP